MYLYLVESKCSIKHTSLLLASSYQECFGVFFFSKHTNELLVQNKVVCENNVWHKISNRQAVSLPAANLPKIYNDWIEKSRRNVIWAPIFMINDITMKKLLLKTKYSYQICQPQMKQIVLAKTTDDWKNQLFLQGEVTGKLCKCL